MELLVCIKQVPDDSVTVTLGADGTPKLDGISRVVNAFDTYALEMATRFKEAHGGTVTVLSVGGEDVVPSLRSCLSVGADHAFYISGDANADNKSHLLAKAAQTLEGGPFDVIFCGCESTDSTSGKVGAQLAEQLGIPAVTNILSLEPTAGGISAHQETEDGYRVVEAPCPCVVTVVKPAYEPRYPSIKSKMAARKMPIGGISPDTLATESGSSSANVQRLSLAAPQQRKGGIKIQEKEAADSVRRAVELLAAQKLI